MILALANEPGSLTHAAFAGWDHPVSREAMNQLALIDVLLMRWQGKKYRPYPRAWDAAAVKVRAIRLEDAALHRKLRPHLYK